MVRQAPAVVRHRKVFYIPGYDPIHPRRYRELYRKEGAAQAAICGYEISLSPKTAAQAFGWHALAQIEGQRVEADFEVLIWSDLVRESMGQSILATYGQLLRSAWVYIGSGALFRLIRLRKGPTITAIYPVFALLAQLAFALLLGALSGELALAALAGSALGWAVALALGIGVFALTLERFRAADGRLFVYYLMHNYAYSAGLWGAYPPELEQRLASFGQRVASALDGPWDEVLVVGHSSGAHLAVSILADLARKGAVRADGPQLGLLSLGQVVPMISFLPRAQRLRADLHDLSASDALAWVDVSAPGDGCSFALCDPVSVSGVAPQGKRWPLVISAAFSQTLSPALWKKLRWRFFRLHFQYLCAFDRPNDYDYFKITAGPRSLRDRYAARKPSQSRIERSTNKFTDIA
jgi:hypothetical protein